MNGAFAAPMRWRPGIRVMTSCAKPKARTSCRSTYCWSMGIDAIETVDWSGC